MWQSVLPEGQTYVYFVQGPPGTEIKIGYTNRVGSRVSDLQTGNPKELRLLAVLPAPPIVETAYHRQLKPERVLGEWFLGPMTVELTVRAMDIAEAMMAAYDGSGNTPDIYDFDDSLERPVVGPTPPVPVAEPELEVVPAGIGRKRRRKVSGNFFGQGMRPSWRVKPTQDAPVTRYFVDPETLRDEAA